MSDEEDSKDRSKIVAKDMRVDPGKREVTVRHRCEFDRRSQKWIWGAPVMIIRECGKEVSRLPVREKIGQEWG